MKQNNYLKERRYSGERAEKELFLSSGSKAIFPKLLSSINHSPGGEAKEAGEKEGGRRDAATKWTHRGRTR